MAATRQLIERGAIPRDESIVICITGNGYKTIEVLNGRGVEPIRIGRSLAEFEASVARRGSGSRAPEPARSWRATARRSAASPAAPASTPSGSRSITARRAAVCSRSSHDIEALRDRSPAAWMRNFDERYKRTAWPYGSGVWGKKEWICPELRDENVVSMDEGGTNMFWAERFGREIGLEDLWVKQCGNSHTGSFKDLGMTVLVSVVKQMIADGGGVRAVACASTGDTSAALAAYAAAAGIPAVVILPRGKVTPAQLVQPLANGALRALGRHRFRRLHGDRTRLAEEEGVYLANSMNSLRLEGQKTLSVEIVQQFDWEVPDVDHRSRRQPRERQRDRRRLRPDGGARRDRETSAAGRRPGRGGQPAVRAYTHGWRFEPMTAQPTHRVRDPDRQSGLGRQAPSARCSAIDGIVEQATESELADAAARADRTGMFNCPHTGVALAVARETGRKQTAAKTDRVMVISTANGLKFTDFKVALSLEPADAASRRGYANPPIELPNDYDQVRRAVDHLVAPTGARH